MPYQPTAGDRVRINGWTGPVAVIVRFTRKRDGVPFFKARPLTGGALVWPDHVVADSTGAYERTCTDCEITFKTDIVQEPLCPNCDRRGQHDGPDSRRYTGARRWRGR